MVGYSPSKNDLGQQEETGFMKDLFDIDNLFSENNNEGKKDHQPIKDEKLSSLDDLFQRSMHYKSSRNYTEALKFVIKLRNVAPYNAWLLREQNPNITYVSNAYDWSSRFNREIKADARAYVILKAFGPVDFVYDVKDTIGDELPTDIQTNFRANGIINSDIVSATLRCCQKKGIQVDYDKSLHNRLAGWAKHSKLNQQQHIVINAEHSPEVQFSTLCHELAHLMLGHLGNFHNCECKERWNLLTDAKEIEAESVSWLVCKRLNITTDADRYLGGYFGDNDQELLQNISIDNILTTAGRIESMIFNHTCRVKK